MVVNKVQKAASDVGALLAKKKSLMQHLYKMSPDTQQRERKNLLH